MTILQEPRNVIGFSWCSGYSALGQSHLSEWSALLYQVCIELLLQSKYYQQEHLGISAALCSIKTQITTLPTKVN